MDRSDVRVLLVDDDEEEYLLVRRYLGSDRTGTVRLTWAPTFEVALTEVESATHDICLLDHQLGEKTGIELLREIRNRGYDLPVILMTGHGSLELDLAAMELGAFDYLEKNELTPALLERSIRYTIADHRTRAALRHANEELERRVQERTAELNRSNRELEQFARMIASDLQEPLVGLTRQVERLKVDAVQSWSGTDRRSVQAAFDSILHTARNMELLVESVLEYAQAGRQVRPLDAVDLAEAAQNACALLHDAIAEAEADVAVEGLPTIRGDRRLIEGVFRNLLDNAIQFRADDPPRVRVWSERKGNMWMIGVRDNGIGMDPEEAGEAFLLFHRGTDRAGRPGTGLGLGLALCRKIVQYHGGRIWVDSERGRGCSFYFTFPATI